MDNITLPTTHGEDPSIERRASLRFWIGLIVVLLATGYIVTTAMSSTVHYHEVAELANQENLVGSTMRVRGLVVEGSHRLRGGSLDQHIFVLGGGQHTVTVLFGGVLPDQFREGGHAIATGVLRDLETFEADSITAQCPSRYENMAPTAEGANGNQ